MRNLLVVDVVRMNVYICEKKLHCLHLAFNFENTETLASSTFFLAVNEPGNIMRCIFLRVSAPRVYLSSQVLK